MSRRILFPERIEGIRNDLCDGMMSGIFRLEIDQNTEWGEEGVWNLESRVSLLG